MLLKAFLMYGADIQILHGELHRDGVCECPNYTDAV